MCWVSMRCRGADPASQFSPFGSINVPRRWSLLELLAEGEEEDEGSCGSAHQTRLGEHGAPEPRG